MSCAIEAVFQIDPAQVGESNTFGNPNDQVSRLTNDVHPLWAFRNWSRNIRASNTPRMEGAESRKTLLTKGVQRARCNRLPAHTYRRILPALRLASLFLEKSLPWLWNLRFAPYRPFGKRKQTELHLDEGNWTPVKETQIRRVLEGIAR